MPGTFRISKIAGIDIDIHVSWIIIVVLLTVSLATGWFPQLYPGWSTPTYWLIAFLSSLLLFVSVLLHELAHSLVARRRGLPVRSITLFIFGGVSNIEQEPKTPGIEFQMAFVGPFTKPATVPANISLQQLVDAYFLPGGLRYALVMQGDKLVGLITLSDIRPIPREQWGQVPVSTAMIPLARLHVAAPQQSLSGVFPFMADRDVNQLPVVENGALVGILSRDAILRVSSCQF
jgi:Zn-dependent protease